VSGLRLKWYGTATVLLEQDGTKLLFDPFIPLNKESYKPPLEELSESDGIFVTHCHFDHISAIPSILKRCREDVKVYCTREPKDVLVSKGLDKSRIYNLKLGDVVNLDPFEVHILKGKHIVFDWLLILKTIFNLRVLTNLGSFVRVLKAKEHRRVPETIVCDIRVQNKRVLLLGSLNLDAGTEYGVGANLLVLPLQGRSDICSYAIPFIDRLKPEKVLLDHIDDTFPPFSSPVKTEPFISHMEREYPAIPVICRQASAEWIEL